MNVALIDCFCPSPFRSAQGVVTQGKTGPATFWMSSKTTDWQIFHNNYLAVNYGTYRNQVCGLRAELARSSFRYETSPDLSHTRTLSVVLSVGLSVSSLLFR